MTFKKVSATVAELHQPPTPTFNLESTTRFTLREPDAIDFDFTFNADAARLQARTTSACSGRATSTPRRTRACTSAARTSGCSTARPAHNSVSTVVHAGRQVRADVREGSPRLPVQEPLAAEVRLAALLRPLPQAHLHRDVRPHRGLRLTHSPSGGGTNTAAQTTNPAWDFQYVLPKYEVNTDYDAQGAADLPRALFAQSGAEGIRGLEEGTQRRASGTG